jgi:hypothetical protein
VLHVPEQTPCLARSSVIDSLANSPAPTTPAAIQLLSAESLAETMSQGVGAKAVGVHQHI